MAVVSARFMASTFSLVAPFSTISSQRVAKALWARDTFLSDVCQRLTFVITAMGRVIVAFGSLVRSDTVNDIRKWGFELVAGINAAMAVADLACTRVQGGVTRSCALHGSPS